MGTLAESVRLKENSYFVAFSFLRGFLFFLLCVFFFLSFLHILTYFYIFFYTYYLVMNLAMIFLVAKILGLVLAAFLTFQAFRRRHTQGVKIWTAFWIALPLDFFVLSLLDGIIKATFFLPDSVLGKMIGVNDLYFAVQLARFIVVWMVIAQAAGHHLAAIFRSAGLLPETDHHD